jgi:lipase (class 3)
MGFPDNTAYPYNYYPNTAIELCVISYDDMAAIPVNVKTKTSLSVVWGPAELTGWLGIAYSLVYVAADSATGEHFVVIRGTNPDSLYSWLDEDFDLSPTPAFNTLPGCPPGAPDSALISQGTFNGMSDLIHLQNPGDGSSLVDFLKLAKPTNLYVTGHSLGGTLTAPLFAYLNAMLQGGGPAHNMALWSFAGLTPGGVGFNTYFNSVLINDQGFKWRIQNSLDIAPLMWWSKPRIRNIYAAHDLYWGLVEWAAIDHLFDTAQGTGIGYSQPQPGLLLPGQFDESFPDEFLWAAQAMHQHHTTTYQKLVAAHYPLT